MHSRGQWGATGELSIDPNSDQHVKKKRKRKKWDPTDELEESAARFSGCRLVWGGLSSNI